MTQTLAVGRAFAWARHFHPGASSFVRARLDSAWCVPWGAAARTPGQMVLNQFTVEGSQDGPRWAGDIFAFASADAAPAYFDAWRVWGRINCSALCLAGAGTAACHFVGLARQCTGESPLTSHLCDHYGGTNQSAAYFAPFSGRQTAALGVTMAAAGGAGGALARPRPQWRRMERLPYPLLHPTNETHAHHRGAGAAPIRKIVADLERRRADTCPGCMPDCLPRGKVMYHRKKMHGRRRACRNDFQSLRCQFRAQREAWLDQAPPRERAALEAQGAVWDAQAAEAKAAKLRRSGGHAGPGLRPPAAAASGARAAEPTPSQHGGAAGLGLGSAGGAAAAERGGDAEWRPFAAQGHVRRSRAPGEGEEAEEAEGAPSRPGASGAGRSRAGAERAAAGALRVAEAALDAQWAGVRMPTA